MLQLSVVGSGVLFHVRHTIDRKHTALINDCLKVELIDAEPVRQFRVIGAGRASQADWPVLAEWKRREFAQVLQSALASGG